MKSRTKFQLFHGLLILFYMYMYVSSVFNLYWLNHSQVGSIFVIVIIGLFIVLKQHKNMIPILNIKIGQPKYKLVKLSVWMMILHFILASLTGLLMRFGIYTYSIHSQSKWIVPVLVVFHLVSYSINKWR